MHQFLIQWVGDEVEVVHGDASACVTVADSTSMSDHKNLKCLTDLDLSDCEAISSTKDGFVAAASKPIEDQATPSFVI